VLLDDILPSAPPSAQWHDLIQRKLQELDRLLNNVQSMKRLLEDIMECDDAQLEECIYLIGQKHQSQSDNARLHRRRCSTRGSAGLTSRSPPAPSEPD
jgi:hypothetical protein